MPSKPAALQGPGLGPVDFCQMIAGTFCKGYILKPMKVSLKLGHVPREGLIRMMLELTTRTQANKNKLRDSAVAHLLEQY